MKKYVPIIIVLLLLVGFISGGIWLVSRFFISSNVEVSVEQIAIYENDLNEEVLKETTDIETVEENLSTNNETVNNEIIETEELEPQPMMVDLQDLPVINDITTTFVEILNNRMTMNEINSLIGFEPRLKNEWGTTRDYAWDLDYGVYIQARFFEDGSLNQISLQEFHDFLRSSFEDVNLEYDLSVIASIYSVNEGRSGTIEQFLQATRGIHGVPTSWQQTSQRWPSEQMSFYWMGQDLNLTLTLRNDGGIPNWMFLPQTLDSIELMQDYFENAGAIIVTIDIAGIHENMERRSEEIQDAISEEIDRRFGNND